MSYLWLDPAFLDFALRESFSLPSSHLGTSCIDPTGYPRGLGLLSRLLHRLAAEPSLDETIIPHWLKSALGRAQQYFGLSHGNPAWDTSSWTRLSSLVHASPSQKHEQITALVAETVGRLNGLQPGGLCVLPGAIAIDVEKSPIFVLLIVCRPEDRPQFFEFAVVNASGYGTEFHAFRIDDSQSSTGSVQRDFLIVLEDVIPDRLTHSSFWVSVYRLLSHPAPTNVHTFYSILLPHLNCKPLLSNWISPTTSQESQGSKQSTISLSKDYAASIVRRSNRGGAWFTAPALRTPGSSIPGSVACLYYILQTTCQLQQDEISIVMILFWWTVCLSCRDDLSLATATSSRSGSTDYCSSFHLDVVKCAMR